jgi:D-alanyl-D-alanine carboxypeptidase (penicillin-binding protein 5/6)
MFSSTVCFGAEGEPDATALYSLSACLMDADSGRILYEKDGDTLRANASTTKILTCILALEYGNLDDYVSVSKYAASMPDVQLNMNTGEQYRLGDLLYSLMLESHNDTAVAIAEHIGGSVEEFAAMMNEKAEEIGCTNSHFITPNGLDATETIDGTDYIHGTTAADLCRIMAYCIQNEQFLEITQTASYTFTNYVTGDDGNTVAGARSFTVNNKNAFLSMMDGVISGKTGFTGNAGYCYVTALKRDERTFTVALLGCGWPNNKTYKWQDATLLLNYGLDYFQKQDFFDYKNVLPKIAVEDGIVSSVSLQMKQSPLVMLARADDVLQISYDYPRTLTAPVYAGDLIGTATYTLNGEVIQRYNLYAGETVAPYDFSYCFGKVLHRFLQF